MFIAKAKEVNGELKNEEHDTSGTSISVCREVREGERESTVINDRKIREQSREEQFVYGNDQINTVYIIGSDN